MLCHRIALYIKLAVLCCPMGYVYADPVNINITGRIVANPCVIDSGSVNQSIDFKQLRSTDLKRAGSATRWEDFDVKMNSYPADTRQVIASFSGLSADEGATLYANQTPDGAENVAIQMVSRLDPNQNLGPGSTMSATVDASRNITFPLAGRLLSVNGNATPGKFTSVVMITMTYQ